MSKYLLKSRKTGNEVEYSQKDYDLMVKNGNITNFQVLKKPKSEAKSDTKKESSK